MKKIDRFVIYLIACFLALNNAYQTFGTSYHLMYWSWIVIACVCFLAGLIMIGRK